MGLGKWIAGALGWAMFGPIGGILGYYFASGKSTGSIGKPLLLSFSTSDHLYKSQYIGIYSNNNTCQTSN